MIGRWAVFKIDDKRVNNCASNHGFEGRENPVMGIVRIGGKSAKGVMDLHFF